jgi:hypothetical protein
MCLSVFFGAHAHGDWCEAMHWCACLYVLMPEAHAHCDCCETMHACVGVSVWACTRRMLTVIAARQCVRVCGSVCLGLRKAHAHCDCCEAMHACVGVCVCVCE